MRRAWLRTSEGGPSLFCVCARACVCKHTCVHTGSRCKTDFLLGLESKNKHSLEHSVSNFHYILVTKLHFCGTLVLKPQKEPVAQAVGRSRPPRFSFLLTSEGLPELTFRLSLSRVQARGHLCPVRARPARAPGVSRLAAGLFS